MCISFTYFSLMRLKHLFNWCTDRGSVSGCMALKALATSSPAWSFLLACLAVQSFPQFGGSKHTFALMWVGQRGPSSVLVLVACCLLSTCDVAVVICPQCWNLQFLFFHFFFFSQLFNLFLNIFFKEYCYSVFCVLLLKYSATSLLPLITTISNFFCYGYL